MICFSTALALSPDILSSSLILPRVLCESLQASLCHCTAEPLRFMLQYLEVHTEGCILSLSYRALLKGLRQHRDQHCRSSHAVAD